MRSMNSSQSALVVLVPEAEALIGPFRAAHECPAGADVPAHITLLYPFKPPYEIDAGVVATLERCFARFTPVDFNLAIARRFPGLLYLVPDPDDAFRRMTLAIWERFADTPPYGGRYAEIVPHLSVAQIADEAQLDRVHRDFAAYARERLPIRARAAAATLMIIEDGRWRLGRGFGLDGA